MKIKLTDDLERPTQAQRVALLKLIMGGRHIGSSKVTAEKHRRTMALSEEGHVMMSAAYAPKQSDYDQGWMAAKDVRESCDELRILELEAENDTLQLMWENASHGQMLGISEIVELKAKLDEQAQRTINMVWEENQELLAKIKAVSDLDLHHRLAGKLWQSEIDALAALEGNTK